MGKLYQQVGRHLSGTFIGEVIVEIGSDRWEGSVPYLLGQGFNLIEASDYGVILGRGQQNYIV
jgi:hypothetical protein